MTQSSPPTGRHARRFSLILTLLSLACGGDSGPGTGPDSPAGFMEGTWRATNMIVTSHANPDENLDLIVDVGGQFTMDVQRSGRYLAILSGFGQSASESGTLSIEGEFVVLRRTFPDAEVSFARFTRSGPDVTLDAESRFDFNFDGVPEPADLVTVLTPR